ncbi:hypothetical protein ANCCEY_14156 [Ancylostoma ceylanicum]|uniref:Uncharacterized protein n=1 Tax=Ancylostoma ceylanicum TaxID=53326 RepID=A0A0D6L609_9BILA|nr:hypothetical protein ANCCEY_14156 [Ancylostoma ceylanicum]
MTHNVLFLNRLFYGQLGNEFKVRRSSSLQFTHPGPVVIDDAKLSEVSALSRSSSIYSGFIRSQCTICCLLSVSGNLSKDIQTVVAAPITSLVLFQIATAMLLIIGVLIDTHFLMVPFLLNSIVHICLAVGIAISVLFSSGEVKKLYGPHYEGFELFGVDENCELIDRIRNRDHLLGGASALRVVHCCGRNDDNADSGQAEAWLRPSGRFRHNPWRHRADKQFGLLEHISENLDLALIGADNVSTTGEP